MNKIFKVQGFLAGLIASLLSVNSFALQGQMIAKDYWLKKHVPDVATELCEGKVVRCLGLKHDACAELFLPAAKACGEKSSASLPDYLSGKEMTKKYKLEIRECAWAASREQVGRQIRANPKPLRPQLCIEFMVPNAPSPKVEEDSGNVSVRPKPVN